MTPAEEIRAAAKLMREQHGPAHVRHKFWHALAGWLDAEGRHADGGEEGIGCTPSLPLKVARAYLGTEARDA